VTGYQARRQKAEADLLHVLNSPAVQEGRVLVQQQQQQQQQQPPPPPRGLLFVIREASDRALKRVWRARRAARVRAARSQR
jgi:hypothetical protein